MLCFISFIISLGIFLESKFLASKIAALFQNSIFRALVRQTEIFATKSMALKNLCLSARLLGDRQEVSESHLRLLKE